MQTASGVATCGYEQHFSKNYETQLRELFSEHKDALSGLRGEAACSADTLSVSDQLLLTQLNVAKAKSEFMGPGIRGWFSAAKAEKNLTQALDLNDVAMRQSFTESVSDIDLSDSSYGSEIKNRAVEAAIINKSKIDILAVEQYAGKKSGRFINWVRSRSGVAKTILSGAGSFVFDIWGIAGNASVARSISKAYVANNSEAILRRDQEASEVLLQKMQGLGDGEEQSHIQFVARSALMDGAAKERAMMMEEIIPIGRGALIGGIATAGAAIVLD